MRSALALALVLVLAGAACAGSKPAGGPTWFADETADFGVRFRHWHGTVLRWLPQVTGPGAAVLDYDGDGQLDLFFVQGAGPTDGPRQEWKDCPDDKSGSPCDQTGRPVPAAALYRATAGKFREVAATARVDARAHGMAVVAVDLDNDGYPDLAVTQYAGPTLCFRNNGDGTFTDVTRASGLAAVPMRWGASLTALDRDRDGFADLYVGQYLAFDAKDWLPEPELKDEGKGPTPVTLLPGRYPALPNVLLANRADGTFADVTAEAGVADPQGQTLGALAADFDADGWPDLLVANDGPTKSQVFQNDRTGRFRNVSAGSWADEARGSMGFALGDVAGTGATDVYVTHWMNQPSLYRVNARPGKRLRFVDQAAQRGLTSEIPFSGWAAGFLDIDNDGFDDLLQIGGHTGPPPSSPLSGRLDPHPTYLFRNDGHGFFSRVRGSGADPMERQRVGRSAAFGDLDRDGAVDVVLNNNNAAAEIWHSIAPGGAWIALVPEGTASCRDGLGANLTVQRGTWTRRREVVSGESFFSTNARTVTVGLGDATGHVLVRACWPSGLVEEHGPLEVRARHRIVEGSGRSVKVP